MASTRNNGKSGSNGLKILWIPGRKRHDKKGIYSSTSKEVNKNYLPQRKNQVWSLGGTNEQRKLINTNGVDDIASGSALTALNPLHVAAATAAGTGAASLKADDNLNLDEQCVDQEKIVDKEILRNGEAACNTDNIDIDVEDQAYHNAGTIRYRKKTGSNNTDLDSIEHLDFEEEEKKHEVLEDDIDSVSMQRMRSENAGQRRRRQTKKKLKNLEEDKEKNQKLVDCLYVGLMFADCPCSIM